jgi:protein involved in polysaccharide export with SLBB domain
MEGWKMKNMLWITGFVIILVCINWFSEGFAQPTPEQIAAYQEYLKLEDQRPATDIKTYKTPPIFDEEQQEIDTIAGVDTMKVDSFPVSQPPRVEADTPTHQLALPQQQQVNKFGHNLFQNPQVAEINPALIPEDYLLGPGDNIIISLWGRVQQEWNLTVDRQGKVFIPKVGEITAWGMTLNQFAERLDANLTKVYTGYERRVTLGKIRTIKVFVYGEIQAPGGYAISALSTLFNALYMAGGPTDNGSFRQISLIRDHEILTVDLYDFLIKGDKKCDVPLASGDVIFVPLVGAQATIRGKVKRPAIFELVGGEKISDLIELGGGPTADAFLDRLMLDRISGADSRKVIDLNFSGDNEQDLILADGDDLSVFSIYQMRQNFVWINGNVKHPGTFERSEGMRISDLIEKGQLLPNKVYTKRADLYRHCRDGQIQIIAISLDNLTVDDETTDILLEDLDSLYVYSTDQVGRKKRVFIDGRVQRPGEYPLYEGMKVSDLIFLAGNLRQSAYTMYAELARVDSVGINHVIRVLLDQFDNGGDILLQENDHLFIRKTPGYSLHRTVTIEGEVRFPGQYALTFKNETLWELLGRAGGFSEKAFPIGTVFRRKAIVDDLQRKDINNILISSQPLLADSTGILKPVPTMNMPPESMDRIIIDMELLMATNGAEGDFVLHVDDHIFIPETPTGISILGEVCANGTIKYEPDKKVKHYLGQAGGFTKRADKGETRLIKANGRVYSSGGVQGRKVDLGDVIVVPSEIKKERDWLKYISTSLSILTGVATTVLIVDRL